jgi:iron complex outermembrane receptor protein
MQNETTGRKLAARAVCEQQQRQNSLKLAFMMTTALIVASVVHSPAYSQISSAAARISLDIPAQPLSQALVRFSTATGMQVFVNAGLLRGINSPGVNGALTPSDALSRLLAGTGLTYRFTNASTVAIERPDMAASGGALPSGVNPLDTIDVQADGSAAALQNDGTAHDGYRARKVSAVGPLGPMELKDTPFTINVAPREFIENIQAQSPDDIFKVMPNVRSSTPQITGWSPMVNIRGFGTYDFAEDGFHRAYSHATSLEDKERVEILNGLSGFLYGAASPGGMVNYVYKRPTYDRLNSVTMGNYGGSQRYVHGDFGGRIDPEGRAGYRLNVVKQGGDTAIDDQNINRWLISGAFDWNITDRLKLELNASHTSSKTANPSTYWTFRTGVPHSFVPDPARNWGQKWIRDEFKKDRMSAKLTYEINENITIRGGYLREYSDRPVQDHIMNSVRGLGEYYQIAIHSGRTKSMDEAANAIADVKFDTGAIGHKLSFGYYMSGTQTWGTTYSPNSGWLGPFPLSSPTYLAMPAFPADTSNPFPQNSLRNNNFFVGDHVTFNEYWSLLAGVNYSRIENSSYDVNGMKAQPDYGEGRASPSVSLMYKVTPWATLYGTYIEGLEQGGIAPDTAVNFGAVMPPMISKQIEAGVKAEVGGTLLTAALFDIEKAYEFTDPNGVYTQNGRQRHRGVEFTATGKVTDRITVVGGLTFLDAIVEGGDFDGRAPMNVAKLLAKIYAEYELPSVHGLFLTGGIYHTGKQWADNLNTDRLDAYTTLDLGIRYTTEQFGNPLTLRLNVANVTGEKYWLNSYYLGTPRTVAFSAQMKF